MEPRRPAPPKSGRSAELPGSLSGALRSVPPRAREPHAPPPPGHASPLPPRSPPAAVKLGRPRLAPGPRAHTKLLRPQLPGARGKGGRGGERGRGAAGASARPEARDAAPPPPPRSPPGPAREHRAEARPAQSPALAGNSAARLPRSRLARPTHEHPLPGPTTPPAQPAAGPEGPSCSPRNAKPRREGGGPGGGGGGRTWGRRGSAAPEKRILPGPRRPRPPDSHNPAPRADGRSRGARSSAWETEPRRSKKLQRKEIQGQGSHPLAILQLRSRGQTRAPETWHWIGAHNLFFKGNLELHLKIL